MNRNEKIAWYNLAVISASTLLFIAVFLSIKASFPLNLSLKISCSAFGLLGFIGLGPTIFKKMPGIENYAINDGISNLYGAEFDERDMLIGRRAFSHGFGVFWLILVFSVMFTWVFLRFIIPDGELADQSMVTIDVDLIPLMLFPAVAIVFFGSAISTILQYRNISFGDNSEELGAGPGRKTIAYTLAFSTFFIAFNIFMVSYMNWMFAVKFLMISFGAIHLIVRSLIYNPGPNFALGDFRVLKISEWIARVIFIVLYLATIGTILIQYLESVSLLLIAPQLFILGFGTLIFLLSIMKYGRKPQMENRHEEA